MRWARRGREVSPGSRVYRDNLDENGAAIRMRAAAREIRNNGAEPWPDQAMVPPCGSRVSIATGPGKLAGPAMSAMPRKRRLVVKASSVAMGHFLTNAAQHYEHPEII